ncbi:dehydration-responsive element-binding protein 1H-like [Triticum dicoccoides]|uniref:dehydration-responsive element-binding protein 1H-like n=1 Tax=Triticum dicoccoides TaxID=85692 RepID=UPI001890B9E7|nr:dehydration-responsive element-binding protein 1H-like [Triticum dicoccoides]
MGMSLEHSSSASSSSTTERGGTARPWPPKRPAGRTKFRETRHPVFRGVRRRGSAGRWVCEVRVPGDRGTRLWLGTYFTAEAAARAHDAAMLMLRGRSAACLNFRDSAWLLSVPPAFSNLSDVRHAAVQAVADFLRRPEATDAAAGAAQEVTSSVAVPSAAACSVPSFETAQTSGDATFEAPAALSMDMFDLDCLFGETDSDTNYYADLAHGLLMEPPPTMATGAYWDNGDCADAGAGADVALWSY